MSLNCSEIDLILQQADLSGAYIQKVLQSSYSTLVLGLYKNEAFNLFFSLQNSACLFNISKRKFFKPEKPLRFMELLRSRIIGFKIEEAKQINADRIVKFVLKNNNSGEVLFLYFRLWSGASNIILTDNQNKIIDAFYRRPGKNEITGEYFLEEKPITDSQIQTRLKKFPVRDYDKNYSFSEFIEKTYTFENAVLNLENIQTQIQIKYSSKIDDLNKTKKKLLKKMTKLENPEKLQLAGNLILSNIANIKAQAPTDSFCTEDYTTGKPILIKLDKHKSPQENANDYYARAKKVISGKANLEDALKNLDKQIKVLNLKYKTVKTETDILKLKKILKKISLQQSNKALKNKSGKEFVGLKFDIEGFLVFVGRNANENDLLLRHWVRGRDLWMHVRDYPGSYVFIKAKNKKTIPLEVLLAAGNLAVFYSKAKKSAAAYVYYTEVKYLRRVKNAKTGLVIPERDKTLYIRLNKKIMAKNELRRII